LTHSESRTAPSGRLSRIIVAEPHEIAAVAAGFLLFFLLFSSYFMLRPVRETMGVAGGVENLPWMFTGTFLVTLVIVPFYGWLSSRVQRRRLLPAAYSFVALTLVAFAAGMMVNPGDVWLGRAFYIWISVLNLFVFSLGWSLMADVFQAEQARRLFGQVAAGASLGGLAGPLLSGLLVGVVGEPGLLIIAAALMLGSLAAVRALLAWRERNGPIPTAAEAPTQPIGGNIFAGLTLIARSPYLLGLSAFVVLLASVNTFLYLEQARLVDLTFADRAQQTQAFAAIDVVVQSLTIFIQFFITGRLTKKLGVTVLLTAVPVLMVAGLGILALAATFPVLVGVMVLRRVGEYALVKPGRDMLFTTVDPETKYKAKNVVDTFVYRGGDAISAWVSKAVGALGMGAALVMIVGALLAAVWAAIGYSLGRIHDKRSAATT
jgi:AAA family ATP:ADP antiporter